MSTIPLSPDYPAVTLGSIMRRRLVVDGLISAGATLAIVAVIGSFLTVRVFGISMEPALMPGDNLLADKVLIRWIAPSRGDLVEIELPNGVSGLKRVIALPGDAIEIAGSSTFGQAPRVLIQQGSRGPWLVLEEPYLKSLWINETYCCDANGRATSSNSKPFTLPAREYFVMGDNRNVSEDSRVFGPVPQSRLLGRVLLRYWPIARITNSFPRPRLINAG